MASPAPPSAPLPTSTLAAPGVGQLASRGLRAPGADLQGASLAGQDLSFADLIGADLRGADLQGAVLHGARLRGARLDGANLEGAWAEDLDLEGASLIRVRLADARLPAACLLEAKLHGADLRGCSLPGADLRGAALSEARLDGADLRRADLSGAELTSIEATGARWTKARIRGARGLSETTRQELLHAGAWEGLASPELAPALALASRLGRPLVRGAIGLGGRARSGARTWWSDQAQARKAAALEKAEARALAARVRLAETPLPAENSQANEVEASLRAESFAAAAAQVRARRDEAAARARAELAAQPSRASLSERTDRLSLAELEPFRTVTRVDLSGRSLAGHDLRAVQWEEATLEGSALDGARLDRAVLRRARLDRADLSQASLVNADLRGATASQARLIDADLRGADLRDVDLSGALLAGADLRGARLAGANLAGASLQRALLSDLDLRATRLDDATLSQADLTGARVEGSSARGARIGGALGLTPAQRIALMDAGATEEVEEEAPETVMALVQGQLRPITRRLRAARLDPATEAQLLWLDLRRRVEVARVRRASQRARPVPVVAPAPIPVKADPKIPPVGGPGADLSGAALQGRRLDEADWRGATLTGAQLAGASLRGADLREATGELLDLSGANLSGARCAGLKAPRSQLVDADLRRVDLRGAELVQADLSGADLRGASLQGLDLSEANLTGARLSDLDLSEVRLDGASLNQADLSGAHLAQASWTGADIRGALGIDAEQRALLLDLGAIKSSVLPDARVLLGLGVDIARRVGGAIKEGAASGRRAVASRAQAEPVSGPFDTTGLDLSGQDLAGRHLEGVKWRGALMVRARLEGAQLERADLREAQAEEAVFARARLLEANLAGLQAPRARFVDADLRRTDLRGASLASADLTGADLRGALLDGLDLSGADLTATRLSDLDLSGVRLDGAILDQADLAGTELGGASLDGADLRGALGLSGRQREQLAAAGARVADISLRELVQGLRPRQLAAAAAIVALGLGSYGAARLIGPTTSGGQGESAAELRSLPPAEAMARFEALAEDANLPQERVGWLLEAAGQARLLKDVEAEERLLRQALSGAGEDGAAGAEARMNLATLLAEQAQTEAALALVEPLLDLVQQPPEQRAKAVLLYQGLASASGLDPTERIEGLLATLTALPDASAELLMALASAHSARGETAQALESLDRARDAQLSESTRARLFEARARVYDRAGDLESAAEAYRQMAAQVMAGTAAQQVALLALADVLTRKGDRSEAQALLAALLVEGTDDRVRIRAWIAVARAHEDAGELSEAARSWQAAIGLASVDLEMADEARLSLARLVGGRADDPSLAEFFATMDPDAKAMVELQTRLGKARELLETGAGAEAIPLLEAMLATEGLDAATRRDASLSLGEAFAQEGEMGRALAIWRDLLSESASGDDRVHLQLRMADGLLDAGRLEDAERILSDLVASLDADVAVQGRLGLGRLALARGERERARQAFAEVARLSTDPAWAVRALEELASLAEEGADDQAVIDAWRAVVEAAPPGHPAAARARMATVNRLSASGRLDEAAAACSEAIRTATSPGEKARALFSCAEIDERSGDPQAALARYEAASAMAIEGRSDLLLDSTSGLARTSLALGRPELALESSARALGVASDPAVRIELLELRVQALEALGRDSGEARQARDALLVQVPGAAAAAFLSQAHEARGSGDLASAVALLERARDAAIDPEFTAGVLLELGDAHLESGDLDSARSAWRLAVESTPGDPTVVFQAGMGQASAALVAGEPARAAELLASLKPPDEDSRRQLAEARATALARAGDAGAVAAWEEAAANAGDAEARSSALKGQADALFGLDRFEEALRLYDEAVAAAPDANGRGWAQLGAAEARLALEQPGAELFLDPLRAHADPEIALQAAIRRSQVGASQEQWTLALEVLPQTLSPAMGPAWDVALTLARAAALEGAADPGGAETELQALATRWPQDEEAAVQALLARARLARNGGDEARATALATQAGERARDPALAGQVRDFLAETHPD